MELSPQNQLFSHLVTKHVGTPQFLSSVYDCLSLLLIPIVLYSDNESQQGHCFRYRSTVYLPDQNNYLLHSDNSDMLCLFPYKFFFVPCLFSLLSAS